MTPTITKKWKWASTTPPDRWTITAEAVIRPSTAIADRTRRPGGRRPARTPPPATPPPGHGPRPCRGPRRRRRSGNVHPQQPDDPAVASGPDLGREQLAGEQPPAGTAGPQSGARERAHATM